MPPGVSFEERHNHTLEQVRDHLQDALTVMAEYAVPDDLRVAAFTKVFELLAGKQIITVQHPSPIGLPAMAIPGNRH
jgi:hypothetical protein